MSSQKNIEDIDFEAVNDFQDTTELILKQGGEELNLLSANERKELVRDLAFYMSQNPDATGLGKIIKNGERNFINGLTIASGSFSAGLALNNHMVAAVASGILPLGLKVMSTIKDNVGQESPLFLLIREAESVAQHMRKHHEIPLEQKLDPESEIADYMFFRREIPDRTLTKKTAKYLYENEASPHDKRRARLRKTYGRLITGIAVAATVVAAGDLAQGHTASDSEREKDPRARSEEQQTSKVIDLAALTLLGAGAIGYSAWKKKLGAITPAEELLRDARELHAQLKKEGGTTAHYYSGLPSQTAMLEKGENDIPPKKSR